MKPTLRQLQYLLALREHQSFSQAAESCFVTQSTLSAGIKELEVLLGHTVVDRTHRRAQLTPVGVEIAAQADEIIRRVQEMVESVRHMGGPMCGPLRLGVIPTVAPYLLPKILPPLQEEYPQLDIHLHEGLSAELVQQIGLGQLDVLLMAFPYETPGLSTQILFEEEFMLARAKGASGPGPDKITIEALDPDTLLLLEDGHCLRDHALSACHLPPPRRRRAFSATSLPTLIQMVRQGYGCTLLPAMAAGPEDVPAGIELLRFKGIRPARRIGLAWRQSHTRADEFEILGRLITRMAGTLEKGGQNP